MGPPPVDVGIGGRLGQLVGEDGNHGVKYAVGIGKLGAGHLRAKDATHAAGRLGAALLILGIGDNGNVYIRIEHVCRAVVSAKGGSQTTHSHLRRCENDIDRVGVWLAKGLTFYGYGSYGLKVVRVRPLGAFGPVMDPSPNIALYSWTVPCHKRGKEFWDWETGIETGEDVRTSQVTFRVTWLSPAS